MNKKAVIYARVSTDEQAETNTSILGQLHVCKEYAERNGFNVVGEYVDDYTGTTLERPEFNKLQEALAIEQANVVIVMTEDRLSRNYPDTVTLKALWADQGIELHFTDTGKEEYTFEKMIFSAFRELNAHNEIATLVKRGRKGKNDKVALKKSPVVNSNVPYGYTKVGKNHEAKFVINENESLVVQEMFKWYTVGNGKGPMSLRGIAKHLNEMGISPPLRRKNSATSWTCGQVKRILKNEIYAGVYWWGKTRMVKTGFQQKGKRIKQPEDKWIRLDVPELAIVDRDTFDKVKKRAKRNIELAKRNRKRNYLMSGFFRCGTCGLGVGGYHVCGKDFYGCSSRVKSYLGRSCNRETKQVATNRVDRLVWNWLKNLLNDPIALDAGLDEVINRRSEEIDPKQVKLEKLEELITGLCTFQVE